MVAVALALSRTAAAGELVSLDAPIGGDDTWLSAVALSPVDGAAWVVGRNTLLGDMDPLVAVWDGGVWTELATPNGPYAWDQLWDVDALETGVWTVGYSGEGDLTAVVPIAAWWDGAAWVETEVPAVGFDAHLWFGIDALSADDAWAVGEAYDGVGAVDEAMAWHWDGAAWTSFPVPAVGTARRLRDVVYLAPDDAWAVGTAYGRDGRGTSFLVHWDGTAWSHVPTGGPGRAQPAVERGPARPDRGAALRRRPLDRRGDAGARKARELPQRGHGRVADRGVGGGAVERER
jgi:hypothetical protein